MTIETQDQNEIIENFSLFDNWLDKYQFIIDLGKKLPEFLDSDKLEQNKIKGCQSSVWIVSEYKNNKILFNATSDSSIVKGLIYLLLTVYNNKSPRDIIDTKPKFISSIGLDNHLSPTRKNGLFAMLQAINNIAASYIEL